MRRPSALVALSGVFLCAGAMLARDGQVRDGAAASVVVSTGSISGLVLDDTSSGQPVRRAVVTLTGATLQPHRGAITDDNGRFTLRNLPAGRFTLTVERGGYVSSIYGAKRPGRAGTPVVLAEGQAVEGVSVRIWRGAVIFGVVRDENGEPVVNTAVSAIAAREVTPAAPTLTNAGRALTNDQGEYRIFGLEPGTYLVRSALDSGNRLPPAEMALSEADVDAELAALEGRSRRAGAAPTLAAPGSANRPPPVGANVTAAPIYFPGTAVVTDATPITLTAGEVRGAVDISLARIRTATLRGRAVGLDGVPVSGAFVRLGVAGTGRAIPAALMPAPITNASVQDGTFELGPIAPGTYTLLLRGRGQDRGVAAGVAPILWAQVPVSVTGADVDLSNVTMRPGMTFSGRVVLDPLSSSPPPDLSSLRIELHGQSLSVAPSQSRSGGAPGAQFLSPALVRPDGTFALTDLHPDDYRLVISGGGLAGTKWWLRSAVANGRDVLDTGLRVGPGDDVGGVVLTLSDRQSELSGTFTSSSGEAQTAVFVVAFAADASIRAQGSRRVQAVRPDSSGRFVFANLPAGDYLLAVLTDVDDGQWNDAGFLDSFATASVKLTLADGERKVFDIRVDDRVQAPRP